MTGFGGVLGVVGTTASLLTLGGVLAAEANGLAAEVNGLADVVGVPNEFVVLTLDVVLKKLGVLLAFPNITLVAEPTEERVDAMDSEELDDAVGVTLVLAAERKLKPPDLDTPPNTDFVEPKLRDTGATVVTAGFVSDDSELSDCGGETGVEASCIVSDGAFSFEETLLEGERIEVRVTSEDAALTGCSPEAIASSFFSFVFFFWGVFCSGTADFVGLLIGVTFSYLGKQVVSAGATLCWETLTGVLVLEVSVEANDREDEVVVAGLEDLANATKFKDGVDTTAVVATDGVVLKAGALEMEKLVVKVVAVEPKDSFGLDESEKLKVLAVVVGVEMDTGKRGLVVVPIVLAGVLDAVPIVLDEMFDAELILNGADVVGVPKVITGAEFV